MSDQVNLHAKNTVMPESISIIPSLINRSVKGVIILDRDNHINHISKIKFPLLQKIGIEPETIPALPQWLINDINRFRDSDFLSVAFMRRITGERQEFTFKFVMKKKPTALDNDSIIIYVSPVPPATNDGDLKATPVSDPIRGFDCSELALEPYYGNRLKLTSELAASVGHEIRNPMTAVRGFLQLLQSRKPFAAYESYFTLMIDELDRANSLITEFLSLAKIQPHAHTKQNLNDIITTALPLLETNAILSKKSIISQLEPLPDIFVDRREIQQLLLNIVKNGLEAIEPGKSVYIKTYHNQVNNQIVLEIRDEGGGIDPQILPNIGKPFLTTKENGTGLGLSICYKIAKHNNAVIEVDSSSSGTIFFIIFNG